MGDSMSEFQVAEKLFHACESLQGWAGCKDFVAEGAPFSSQCEPLEGIDTIEDYTEWMAGLGQGPLAGCSYVINGSAYDEENKMALFFATITGSHVGEGGPVPPTGQETRSTYVYAMTMDGGKVVRMEKVWNASWTLRELGWA